jgi:hypothetical protein
LNQRPQDQKRPPFTVPLSRLPRIGDAAADQACSGRRPAEQAVSPATIEMLAHSNDLVERALAILAEETEEWQARREANLSSESTR